MDYKTIKELDERYGTPLYVMDGERYRRNVTDFVAAFRRRYERVIAGYSFKTNYVPALCEVARKAGCYAEVVSEMEYELARRIGFEHVIFNGPIKRPAIFERALREGAIINLDSEYEVEQLLKLKVESLKLKEVRVGLRININVTDAEGKSTIQCGLRFGRFDFPDDILGRNIERLRQAGVKIVSLHGHTSTSDRAVLNYRIITEHMLAVCERYGLDDLEYFDIGGGYFGAAPEGMDLTGRPRYEDYADCVLDVAMGNAWFRERKPWIVIEPGSSVVSNVFTYYTKVYQLKRVGQVQFAMVDGTVFDVKPTMHANNLPHEVIKESESGFESRFDVVGSTCMEKDVMLKEVSLPGLQASDYIQFRGVGAYTICLTPTFINYLPPILAVENGEYREVRRRQQLDDILSVYKI